MSEIDRIDPNGERAEPPSLSFALLAQHQGPLPPAAEFALYEKTMPGAADRILTMAEAEQKHRHAMQSIALQAEARDTRRGMLLAASMGALTLLIGGAAAIFATTSTGAFMGGLLGSGGLVALVTAFIRGRR